MSHSWVERIVSNLAQEEVLTPANCQSSGPWVPQPVYKPHSISSPQPVCAGSLPLLLPSRASYLEDETAGGARPEVPTSGWSRGRHVDTAGRRRSTGRAGVTCWAGRDGMGRDRRRPGRPPSSGSAVGGRRSGRAKQVGARDSGVREDSVQGLRPAEDSSRGRPGVPQLGVPSQVAGTSSRKVSSISRMSADPSLHSG